jgi:hypothetical protein
MFLKNNIKKIKCYPNMPSSIPQNLLENMSTKFVWHWMSKVWKYCSLREREREREKTLLA